MVWCDSAVLEPHANYKQTLFQSVLGTLWFLSAGVRQLWSLPNGLSTIDYGGGCPGANLSAELGMRRQRLPASSFGVKPEKVLMLELLLGADLLKKS